MNPRNNMPSTNLRARMVHAMVTGLAVRKTTLLYTATTAHSFTYDHRILNHSASRSLSGTQAEYRRISTRVGDHRGIRAVVWFCLLFAIFLHRGRYPSFCEIQERTSHRRGLMIVLSIRFRSTACLRLRWSTWLSSRGLL